MSLKSFIAKQKKNIERNHPRILPFFLMIQRRSTKPIYQWPHDKFVKGVMDCYKRHFGYTFDLYHPVLFNEKLQWYKIYYQREDFAQITDKALFKDYIKNKLGEGHTIPMYGVWDNIEDLQKDWNYLPECFVLKSNLQSDGRGIMIIDRKSDITFSKIKNTLSAWLNPWFTLLNSWDYRFYNSRPKILAEKFMQDESGELRDYKFFCFDGTTPYFRVDYGRKQQHHATFFDENKNELDISVSTFTKDSKTNIILPNSIDEMFRIAKLLSKGFPFIRVDFFSCNNIIYLAELTFAPGGGVTPYPYDFNKKLGELFRLPIEINEDTK